MTNNHLTKSLSFFCFVFLFYHKLCSFLFFKYLIINVDFNAETASNGSKAKQREKKRK